MLAPIVVAELVSGATNARDRAAVEALLRDLPLHSTPLEHWLRVGELRRRLQQHGLSISVPDVHVAQCALDLGAPLLTRDEIFTRVAPLAGLRLAAG